MTEPRSPDFHLAQINIARARAALTDPVMASFVEQLDAINALAEQSPGFVWRLKVEDGSPSSYIGDREDARIIVNMSVWTTIEALHAYVYKSAHGKAYADRRQWFEPLGRHAVALWWIRHDRVPTLEDGHRRLALLNARGPSAEAFTFKQRFAPPLLGQDLVHERDRDRSFADG